MSTTLSAVDRPTSHADGRVSRPGEGALSNVRHALVLARRNLMKITGDPGLLLDATVMPMVFALMFVYVLGGAIAGSVASYREFFIPGIMVLTITIVSRTTGTALSVDFSSKLIDRFRSLPIARSAVLSGRILSDAVRMLLSQLVIGVFALVIGFRIHTGLLPALTAVGLIVAFGVALACVSAFIGLSARSVQTVETVTALWMVPLQFGSSLFVSLHTMPGWLQAFVKVNPMTQVVNACRGLLIGGTVAGPLLAALMWIAGILLVFVPLSVWRYSRRR